MKELYTEVGKRIKSFRQKRIPPMSQESLADLVNLSRTSIVNIEQGNHKVQLHTLYDIANALDVKISILLPQTDKIRSIKIHSVESFKPKTQKKIKDLIQEKEQKEVKLIE